MAQQVKIAGALFQDVPSISVPDANDVWHEFTDTSDADAVAADIASGKTAYAGGVKLVGTGESVEVEPLSVTANGTYTAQSGHAYSPVTVNVEGGGGGGGDMSDPIRFFDYDGTLVASYSVADALALTEMPANPSHAGLVAQGWNYTLADMKSQVQGSGTCDIGQMYITDDGKTRIYLDMPEGMESLYLGIAPKGTVIVDWGDGTATDTLTGTSTTTIVSAQHTYAQAGEHVIALECTSGTFGISGYVGSGTTVYASALIRISQTNNIAQRDDGYAAMVKMVELGHGATIGQRAFSCMSNLKTVSMPSSINSLGNYSFQNCYSLRSITIPRMPTYYISAIFQSCFSLKTVSIPFGTTHIGSNMFYGCYSLSRVSVPISVRFIDQYAFYSCSSLGSLIIPGGVTELSLGVLSNCYTIESVTIPDSVTKINNNAFAASYVLRYVDIPDGVTSIGTYVFNGNDVIRSVKIPHGITTIGSGLFNNCRSLADVTIPDGVTSIANKAFYGCSSLTTVTIPSSVTNIGDNAFALSQSLREMHVLPTTPPTLGTNVITGTGASYTIYVPYSEDHSILNAYKTATNWKAFASHMVEEPQS